MLEVYCKDEMYCTWYYCPVCGGHNIGNRFSYCPDCGAKVSDMVESPTSNKEKEKIEEKVVTRLWNKK